MCAVAHALPKNVKVEVFPLRTVLESRPLDNRLKCEIGFASALMVSLYMSASEGHYVRTRTSCAPK